MAKGEQRGNREVKKPKKEKIETISRHGLNHRPILPETCCGVANVGRLDRDAASLSSAPVRYLKMERVARRLRFFASRLTFAAHRCPPFVTNRDTLPLRFGFSWGAFMAPDVQDRR